MECTLAEVLIAFGDTYWRCISCEMKFSLHLSIYKHVVHKHGKAWTFFSHVSSPKESCSYNYSGEDSSVEFFGSEQGGSKNSTGQLGYQGMLDFVQGFNGPEIRQEIQSTINKESSLSFDVSHTDQTVKEQLSISGKDVMGIFEEQLVENRDELGFAGIYDKGHCSVVSSARRKTQDESCLPFSERVGGEREDKHGSSSDSSDVSDKSIYDSLLNFLEAHGHGTERALSNKPDNLSCMSESESVGRYQQITDIVHNSFIPFSGSFASTPSNALPSTSQPLGAFASKNTHTGVKKLMKNSESSQKQDDSALCFQSMEDATGKMQDFLSSTEEVLNIHVDSSSGDIDCIRESKTDFQSTLCKMLDIWVENFKGFPACDNTTSISSKQCTDHGHFGNSDEVFEKSCHKSKHKDKRQEASSSFTCMGSKIGNTSNKSDSICQFDSDDRRPCVSPVLCDENEHDQSMSSSLPGYQMTSAEKHQFKGPLLIASSSRPNLQASHVFQMSNNILPQTKLKLPTRLSKTENKSPNGRERTRKTRKEIENKTKYGCVLDNIANQGEKRICSDENHGGGKLNDLLDTLCPLSVSGVTTCDDVGQQLLSQQSQLFMSIQSQNPSPAAITSSGHGPANSPHHEAFESENRGQNAVRKETHNLLQNSSRTSHQRHGGGFEKVQTEKTFNSRISNCDKQEYSFKSAHRAPNRGSLSNTQSSVGTPGDSKKLKGKLGLKSHPRRQLKKKSAAKNDRTSIPEEMTNKGSKVVKETKWKTTKNSGFDCQVCKRRFHSPGSLQRHLSINNTGFKPCKCKVCRQVFHGVLALNVHIYKSHETKAKPVCLKCNLTLANIRCLYQHVQKHKRAMALMRDNVQSGREKTWKCDLCGSYLVNLPHVIRQHKLKKCKLRPLCCPHCKKRYTNLTSLHAHITTHTNRSYLCDLCGLSFKSRTSIYYHKLTHDSIKGEYLCQVCGQKFEFQHKLTKHMKCHSDTKKPQPTYSCGECNRQYKNKKFLTRHIKVEHMGIKDYAFKCQHCPRQFFSQWQLRDHVSWHHFGKKPYQCPHCPLAFVCQPTLVRHLRKIHTGEKPYKCSHCQQAFAEKNGLQAHEAKVHTNVFPFTCSDCGKGFVRSSSFKSHVKIHTNKKPN